MKTGPALAFAAFTLLAAPPALAAKAPPLAGAWRIDKAEPAPWARPKDLEDRSEEKRLVGQTLTFGPRALTGPAPLGCADATYATQDDVAANLFEGGLAMPGPNGRPSDGVARARRYGMTTRTVQTVEASCSEVKFHRFAPDLVVFALDNRIYTLHPAGK